MKTKRILSGLATLTMVSAIVPLSAFADTEIKQNSTTKSGEMTATYDIQAKYTVTIPAGVTLDSTNAVSKNIEASDVMLESGKKIKVTLTEASNTASGSSFSAKNDKGDSTATYTIGKGTATTGISVGDVVAEFTKNGEQSLTFSKAEGATYAGTHTETLTFGIAVENAAPANPYAANNVGDEVTFGIYDWYIIRKSDDGVTLLMKESFTNKAYNNDYTDITWKDCSLRTYLNDDFYNNNFSEEERAKIALTHNTNPDNDTDDYIYLLSIAEVQGLSEDIRANGSWWWLRSPGAYSYFAAVVYDDGYVDTFGCVDDEYGVRPVINLKF